MNAFILIIPFFLIRFGLLSFFDKTAVKRAASFAPLIGNELTAYILYQISNLILVIYPFFLKIQTTNPQFILGIVVYLLGLVLLSLSIIDFAKPQETGINIKGVYKISRNPMYVAYFILFFACAILTNSWVFLAVLCVFQISGHWIILSEERWCLEKFGEEYRDYMRKVRRYF